MSNFTEMSRTAMSRFRDMLRKISTFLPENNSKHKKASTIHFVSKIYLNYLKIMSNYNILSEITHLW